MSVFVKAFELPDLSENRRKNSLKLGLPRSLMLFTQCSKCTTSLCLYTRGQSECRRRERRVRRVAEGTRYDCKSGQLRGRDLNGRRVRHLNNEIRLKEWRQNKEAKFVAEHLEKGEDSQKPLKTKRRADGAYLEDVEESMSAVKLAKQETEAKEEEGSNEPGGLSA